MELRRLARYDALILTSLLWFMAKFVRYLFPPLFEPFQAAFGVSNTAAGLAFSALMTLYALMQFPSGVIADRQGPVRVIAGGAVVAAVGSLALVVPVPLPDLSLPAGPVRSVPGEFLAIVGGMLLIGVGTGAHKTVAVRLLAAVHRDRTGRALGVLDTVAAFGGVVAPLAVTYALPDWRGLFLASALIVAALTVLFVRRTPRHLEDEGTTAPSGDGGIDGSVAGYLQLMTVPRVGLFVGVTVAFAFAYNGVVAFLPLYLTEAAELEPGVANTLYSGLFVVSLIQLGTGELTDRVGRLPMLFVTVGAAVAGAALLLSVQGVVAVAAAVVVFGLGAHGFRPVRSAFLMSLLPDDAAGGGLGVVRTVLMTAGAVAPGVTGYLIDTRGYDAAFATLGGGLVVALALLGAIAVMRGEE
ncbi:MULTISPECIES: MFS transporter [Halolamina]|uniref:Sugar phosphate permease n=1 Tax=Halolamina pelagica TaxID=699431 RepID=A0A1I5PTV5_9EURY|nr:MULTISPECIES: MFS transporter [Halolamina]NHX34935.1 MFS transporter [Halolamina sp. R1-12]SFP36991.1 Sugar phosphate permease [Halolamina pelagica]